MSKQQPPNKRAKPKILSPSARPDPTSSHNLFNPTHFFRSPTRVTIPEHRKAIDKLDAHIVKLLNERTKHVLAIGEIKVKAGEEIYAPHRERAVLHRICKLNPGPMTGESLRAIYREIMSSALALEKSMTVAYLGPEATFTHQAAIRRFGSSLRYSAQKKTPPPSPACWRPKNTACRFWSTTSRTMPPTRLASWCWGANAVPPPARTAPASCSASSIASAPYTARWPLFGVFAST